MSEKSAAGSGGGVEGGEGGGEPGGVASMSLSSAVWVSRALIFACTESESSDFWNVDWKCFWAVWETAAKFLEDERDLEDDRVGLELGEDGEGHRGAEGGVVVDGEGDYAVFRAHGGCGAGFCGGNLGFEDEHLGDGGRFRNLLEELSGGKKKTLPRTVQVQSTHDMFRGACGCGAEGGERGRGVEQREAGNVGVCGADGFLEKRDDVVAGRFRHCFK
jgi:hypothetical protein